MKQGIADSMTLTTATRHVTLLVAFLAASIPVHALNFVPGSPCESKCSVDRVGSLVDDVVCLDDSYDTAPGSYIKECTSCLLNSTAYDSATGASDVLWALYTLRYTLAECMFAWPKEIVSISSPCQVTCNRMNTTILHDIGPDDGNMTGTPSNDLSFCQDHTFSDKNMNDCALCYGFIPQQLFLANFVQALHIACRQPPALGDTFYPDGRAIFNQSAIAGPPPPSPPSAGSSLTGWKLALVIALPVVGGTLLFAGTCFCCFRFTRKRRAKMAASGRMSKFHDGLAAMSGSTFNSPETNRSPPSKWGWQQMEPDREMKDIDQDYAMSTGNKRSPGLAQGRYSKHSDVTAETTPVRATVPTIVRDDAGPGEGQQRDPYLHEQYFGVADGGADNVRDSHGYPQYPPVPIPPAERGAWVQ